MHISMKSVLNLGAVAGLALAMASGAAYAGHKSGGHKGGGHHASGHHGHHKGGHSSRKAIKRFAKRYDTNKDGNITQAEIDNNRSEWHRKFDTNNDGNLSIDEFQQLWLEAKRRKMVRAFQRFDVDGSADLTLEEYQEPLSEFVENHDFNGDGQVSKADVKKYKRRGKHSGKHGGKHSGN